MKEVWEISLSKVNLLWKEKSKGRNIRPKEGLTWKGIIKGLG